jgi:hypothetical protein
LFLALATAVTLAGVLIVVAMAMRVGRHRRGPVLAIGLVAAFLVALVWHPPVGGVSNLLVLAGGVGGATLLARALTEPRAVVVFLVVASLVDVLSFSDGLTRALIDGYRSGESRLLLHLTLVAPIEGQWAPIVGVGDLFISGAAGAALVRFDRPFWHVLAVLWAGLLLALGVGLWRGGVAAVPFIAFAVAVYAWPRRQPGRG